MRNYGLVLAGVWAALGGCGSGKSTQVQGELTVEGSPKGEITGQRRVVLTFSRPMVARDRIDQPVAAPPIAISPEIPGEARDSRS